MTDQKEEEVIGNGKEEVVSDGKEEKEVEGIMIDHQAASRRQS